MDKIRIPRLVIAGTQSGVGKTTIVSALLLSLRQKGLAVQAYKVGPDYIDPGYHAAATGRPCHNLDSWLMPPERMQALFAATSLGMDMAVAEGVMGLYDGGKNGVASTAAIAKLLQAPVVLVVDAGSAGESVAATALGFRQYDPSLNFAGVILNQLGSDSHRRMIEEALDRLGVRVFGAIRRKESLKVPERHLGLLPVTENDAGLVLENIQRSIAGQLDTEALLELARSAPDLKRPDLPTVPEKRRTLIGVARDEAFSFYYPESLRVLEEMGAKLVFFSPLHDTGVPPVDGLIFGGGFPEIFLAGLSKNSSMLADVRNAAGSGMPILAECGGYMYLCRRVLSFSGEEYSLAGVIPKVCRMENSLQRIGYVEAEALNDNVLCRAGDRLRGHEFHFSRMVDENGAAESQGAFVFARSHGGGGTVDGYADGRVLASYLHLHFAGNLNAAQRFVETCVSYRQERNGY